MGVVEIDLSIIMPVIQLFERMAGANTQSSVQIRGDITLLTTVDEGTCYLEGNDETRLIVSDEKHRPRDQALFVPDAHSVLQPLAKGDVTHGLTRYAYAPAYKVLSLLEGSTFKDNRNRSFHLVSTHYNRQVDMTVYTFVA